MATLYRDYQSRLAPPSQQGTNGAVLEGDLGAEKDVEFDRARQGVLSNIPGQAPPDALDYIGDERMLPRATTESPSDSGGTRDQTFAERLRTAWDGLDGWSYAGSFGGVLRALARAGFTMGLASGAVIIQRTKRYAYLVGTTLTFGTHPGWTFDTSDPRFWNEFGIVFGADVSGLTTGSDSAKLLNSIVATWKPAKARFMGTWVEVSGIFWGWPFGVTWGAGGRNWGGTARFVAPI